ncbi:hypothetical protein [Actinomadura sp. DC4]|uniref:hypothetical protein n=1 Tax=Actinomadura sp. DC4 TaxID=3055069 RepID=UPI0025B093EF|nr:hypothetical protein [Actinomadura sp. DC4]MDN3351314.1 hypothetical protein [Actinomadura sp. DC4]
MGRRRADAEVGRRLGGRPVLDEDFEGRGARTAERRGEGAGRLGADQWKRGERRVEQEHRPVGVGADHRAAGPERRREQGQAAPGRRVLGLLGYVDLQRGAGPA